MITTFVHRHDRHWRQHMLLNLNGWQRIWVILTILWFVGSIAITTLRFPTETRWRDEWLDTSAAVLAYDKDLLKEIRNHCTRTGLSENAELECWASNRVPYENLMANVREGSARLRVELERRIAEELPKAQVISILKGALLWIGPAVILYALGAGVAWIRNGFRHGA